MEVPDGRTVLLSIRPRFADLINRGLKTVELRRRAPKVAPGDTVILYVSSPVKAVAGSFVVSEVQTGDPERVWGDVAHRAGVARDEYDSYFEGTDHAVAIGVSEPVSYPDPVGLDVLREMWPPFTAPQSYRYITAGMVSDLHAARDGTTRANAAD